MKRFYAILLWSSGLSTLQASLDSKRPIGIRKSLAAQVASLRKSFAAEQVSLRKSLAAILTLHDKQLKLQTKKIDEQSERINDLLRCIKENEYNITSLEERTDVLESAVDNRAQSAHKIKMAVSCVEGDVIKLEAYFNGLEDEVSDLAYKVGSSPISCSKKRSRPASPFLDRRAASSSPQNWSYSNDSTDSQMERDCAANLEYVKRQMKEQDELRKEQERLDELLSKSSSCKKEGSSSRSASPVISSWLTSPVVYNSSLKSAQARSSSSSSSSSAFCFDSECQGSK